MPRQMLKKVAIVGDSGVGKNIFTERIYDTVFSAEYLEVIGTLVGKYTTEFEYERNKVALTVIGWDITGRERFSSVMPLYLKGTEGAIIMGRTDRKESLDNLAGWTEKVREVAGNVPMVYVINKVGKTRRGETKVRKLAEQENTKYWFLDFMLGRKDELTEPMAYLGCRLVKEVFDADKVTQGSS